MHSNQIPKVESGFKLQQVWELWNIYPHLQRIKRGVGEGVKAKTMPKRNSNIINTKAWAIQMVMSFEKRIDVVQEAKGNPKSPRSFFWIGEG